MFLLIVFERNALLRCVYQLNVIAEDPIDAMIYVGCETMTTMILHYSPKADDIFRVIGIRRSGFV